MTAQMNEKIGFEVHLDQEYETAIETVKQALKEQGFGVLTTIDVRATMKEKLGEDFRPYTILGACNPPLAHRALFGNPFIGLMLPCNVTVESDLQGGSIVRLVNPDVMMTVGDLREDATVCDVASEARARLESAANALKNI
jgi:uncharacterized protein (DUF302 family)